MTGMTIPQMAVTILMCILGTFGMRALAFLIFPGKETPAFIRYLGHALPPAVFALLTVYCLRHTDVQTAFALPEIIAVGTTIALHLWKRQILLSVAGGTAVYMLLVQCVF